MDTYTVLEYTPGYMPDDDDPATFDDYAEAVAYLNERAEEYAEDPDANYRVEYGIASRDNLAAVVVWDDSKTYDLGRVIEIVHEEQDDETADTPQDDDDYISDDRAGYAVSHAGKHVGTYQRRRQAEAALYLARVKSGYWPNVWDVNDHGNTTLCYFDSHVLRFTDTAYV